MMYEAKKMNNRVNSIDGMRALAMTMVIAQHCGLLPLGWMGVWLFYVISGYVITRGFISEEVKFSHIPKMTRFSAFLKRRAIRIFPAYFAYIFLTIITYFILNGNFSGQTYWGLFTFTYNWQMILGPIFPEKSWPGIGHLWTLSVEQQFYLVFPFLFLFTPARLRWQAMLALVILGPLVRYVYDISFVIPNFNGDIGQSAFSIYAASFCHFDAFLVGVLLAKHEKTILNINRLPLILFAASVLLASAYAVTYAFINMSLGAKGVDIIRNIFSGYLYGQNKQLWLYSVVNLLSFSLFLLVFSKACGTNWLSHRYLAWVGRVSYGGYLLHMFVLWMYGVTIGVGVGDQPLGIRILSFCIIWLVTVMLASLSFKYYEEKISARLKAWATPYQST